MKKKNIKKPAKKKAVKKIAKRAVKKIAKALPKKKPVGKVMHFYDKICVAVVKFNKPMKAGSEICFEGKKACFSQPLESMQYEHQPIKIAKKGQEVGVKVKKEVEEGDLVY